MKALTEPFLNECEKEDLSHIGEVMSPGRIILVDFEGQILAVSAHLLPNPAETKALVGQKLAHHWPELGRIALGLVERWQEESRKEGRLLGQFRKNSLVQQCWYAVDFNEPKPRSAISMYPNSRGVLIEIESATEKSEIKLPPTPAHKTLEGLASYVSEALQRTFDYDRVVFYRFLEDESGEVIGESLKAGADSFLGLRFPDSDIPLSARRLILLNRVRILGDRTETQIPIFCHESLKPDGVDLSLSHFRAVSQMHLRYLENMGVRASLSFPITVRDRLWGIVSCHSSEPRTISLRTRLALIDWSHQVAARVSEFQYRQEMDMESEIKRRFKSIFDAQQESGHFDLGEDQAHELLQWLKITGLAYLSKNQIRTWGQTPLAKDISGFWSPFRIDFTRPYFATDSIRKRFRAHHDYPSNFSGFVLLQNEFKGETGWQHGLFFFRPEAAQTVKWAGKPEKVPTEEFPHSLGPRNSFAMWLEDAKATCEPWGRMERLAARELLSRISGKTVRSSNIDF